MPIQLDAEMRDIFVVLTVEFLAKKAANVREYYFFHRLFREYFNFYFLVLTVKNKTISRKIKMQLKMSFISVMSPIQAQKAFLI